MKLAALAALLVPAVAVLNPLSAQKGLKLGGYILPNYSLMLNQTDSDKPLDQFKYEHTVGMAAGVTVGANFTEGLGVRFSPMYSVQGQNFSYISAEGWEVMNTRKLHYLKAPIMIGFNTNTEFHKVAFTMYGGFQLGLLTHARFYSDDESYTPDESLWDNVTDYPSARQQYNTIDYGPCGEIGMDVMLTYNVMANLRIRGDYSLTDAENKNAAYKVTEAGITRAVPIYDVDRAATTNITGGILLGVTYTLTAR